LIVNEQGVLTSVALTVCRLASAAWIGAASLFVVTAVVEVTHPQFDSATKDALAALRFPAYYTAGFILIPAAILGGTFFVARSGASATELPRKDRSRRRMGVTVGILFFALTMMVIDYTAIYRPMAALIVPPGRPKAAEFGWYHGVSMSLNLCDVGLCAIAAVLACWPVRREVVGTVEIATN
jgi:hypothetical protein